ncbi:MAG TPA: hypothetical protein P5555_17330 [Candidatus Paceibacterota bacterium]|nr:hypothetical protein [Verrucomicrobiota bacterium]HRZ46942.1 hypothetical protein [Candidatus Paceibacterota bacterium]HRZ92108.1 hypothetical protein [Candidatus Paceibacterota bacterium]
MKVNQVLLNQIAEVRKTQSIIDGLTAELADLGRQKDQLAAEGATDDSALAKYQAALAKQALLPRHLADLTQRNNLLRLSIAGELSAEQRKFTQAIKREREQYLAVVESGLKPLMIDRSGRADVDSHVKEVICRTPWPLLQDYRRLSESAYMRQAPPDMRAEDHAQAFMDWRETVLQTYPELA